MQTSLVDEGIDIAGLVTIPESDAQVVLLDSPELAQARAIYSLTSPILSVILLITAALFMVSVLLATRRARTTVAVGITVVTWSLTLQYLLGRAEEGFVNAFAGSLFENAAAAFYNQLLTYLLLAVQGLLLLGAVVIVLGWFCGSTRFASTVRGSIDKGLVEIGQRLGCPGRDRPTDPRIRTLRAMGSAGHLARHRLRIRVGHPRKTLGWTALLLGVLTIAQILMHAPDDAAPDHRPSDALPSSTT